MAGVHLFLISQPIVYSCGEEELGGVLLYSFENKVLPCRIY